MSDKNLVIENMLEEFSHFLGKPRSKAMATKTCVICKGEAKKFKDELSKKEYSISGMCQNCQDSFFE